MNQDEKKKRAAEAAMRYVEDDAIIGVGTGSTVNFFIDMLAPIRHRIQGAVPSSLATEARLKECRIPVINPNSVDELPIYVDGADEANRHLQLIKGGGGALTREKIVAAISRRFICIVDDSKLVDVLGRFPLPVEVIPVAQSHAGRQLAKLGGRPVLRQGFITDNGNLIIDVHNLSLLNPVETEERIDHIAGVVSSGLFARRGADLLLIADNAGVRSMTR